MILFVLIRSRNAWHSLDFVIASIEQSLYYRRRHKYGEIEYIKLYVEFVYVKRWEGPSYREPPTAIVKAPEPGPQGLRPNFGLQI